MKNIEYIMSMVNHVCRDSDWQVFNFYCSGLYCRLVNKAEEDVIELLIEYEFVATITEVWTENGEWFNRIKVFDESWKDFFNDEAEYMGKYTFVQESEEVPDIT